MDKFETRVVEAKLEGWDVFALAVIVKEYVNLFMDGIVYRDSILAAAAYNACKKLLALARAKDDESEHPHFAKNSAELIDFFSKEIIESRDKLRLVSQKEKKLWDYEMFKVGNKHICKDCAKDFPEEKIEKAEGVSFRKIADEADEGWILKEDCDGVPMSPYICAECGENVGRKVFESNMSQREEHGEW